MNAVSSVSLSLPLCVLGFTADRVHTITTSRCHVLAVGFLLESDEHRRHCGDPSVLHLAWPSSRRRSESIDGLPGAAAVESVPVFAWVSDDCIVHVRGENQEALSYRESAR